ncbi:MAG: hypothetical protein GSR85_01150 [Desulfurococcales archaeon]|nr:hypothetical protein [Desulfurococcales archaeon]
MNSSITLETLKEWLKNGIEKPSSIIDVKWIIEEEYKDENGALISFKAIYPEFPISILVLSMDIEKESGIDRKIKMVRLIVETPLTTIDLDLKEREYVYRILLQMSRHPMIKYYLYGDNLNIAIAADLDLKGLGKEEFDDALAFLLAGVLYLYDKFGAKDALTIELLKNLSILISNYVRQGWSRDRLIEYLVDKAGIPKEIAVELIDKYMKADKRDENTGMYM